MLSREFTKKGGFLTEQGVKVAIVYLAAVES